MNIEIITAGITLAVLAGVVWLRSATAGKVTITLNDMIIAAIAAALVLLISGKLAKVVVGNEGVTIETAKEAILDSAALPITTQIEKLPVERIEQALKGEAAQIQGMIVHRVQALDFRLGAGHYVGSVIAEYLGTLTKYNFFRYVIFLDSDNGFFGIIEARNLFSVLNDPDSGFSLDDFTYAVNSGDRQRLRDLPSFVSADQAVASESDKREVLTRMEEGSGKDWLPVIDDQQHFIGIVDRSRLTASMILDVTNQLQPRK